MATAQIAAAGGVDDDRGTLIDRRSFDPWEGLAAWRRMIFMPPSERAAAVKAARQAKKTADQSERRKKNAAQSASLKRAAPSPTRPFVMTDDGRAIVPLSKGYRAIIHAADVPLVEGHSWHVEAEVETENLRVACGDEGACPTGARRYLAQTSERASIEIGSRDTPRAPWPVAPHVAQAPD